MKKSIINILSGAIILFSIISCGGATTEKTDKVLTPLEKLEGKWKITEATGDWAEINVGTIYSFDTDFNFSTKLGIMESKGVILNIDEDEFKVKFENLESEFVYKYKIDGEKLIIEPSSSGQVFTLEKQ